MTNIFWFKGRIGRLNFLLTFLGASILMGIADVIIKEGFFYVFCWIFLSWILICAGIKRFHDLGNPGVYVFLLLIPFALIYVACLKGDVGANKYGVDPLKNKYATNLHKEVKPLNASEHVKAIFKYKDVFNLDNEKKVDEFVGENTKDEKKMNPIEESSNIKYCTHCGIKHKKDAKFCSSCGKSFT